MSKKVLFIDRDGTLIREPEDCQVDTLEKLELLPAVIPALLRLQEAGFRLVMVTNQDGLGTPSFPEPHFTRVHSRLMQLLESQGVGFDECLICPHLPSDACFCRKPNLGLVRKYLSSDLDAIRSYVIGDRETDAELARNMGIACLRYGEGDGKLGWRAIADRLIQSPRQARASRTTKETSIEVEVKLEGEGKAAVNTGIGYLDHMLEQLARHGGIDLKVQVKGDLQVDEHHTVEDTALVLGEALRSALGDKIGIGRYGFVLPMDEAEARCSLDLSGRPYLVFQGKFPRERVGELPTELVPHFFRSLADTLGATLHLEVKGENTHHMVESLFKAFARTLRQAMAISAPGSLPSTKGAL